MCDVISVIFFNFVMNSVLKFNSFFSSKFCLDLISCFYDDLI